MKCLGEGCFKRGSFKCKRFEVGMRLSCLRGRLIRLKEVEIKFLYVCTLKVSV